MSFPLRFQKGDFSFLMSLETHLQSPPQHTHLIAIQSYNI